MNTQQQLQTKLLEGSLASDDFLSELLQLDQENRKHPVAYENLKVLDDSRVRELFAKIDFLSRYNKLV